MGVQTLFIRQESWWRRKCQNIKMLAASWLQRAALESSEEGQRRGCDIHLPRIQSTLKPQALAFKEGFKQSMSGMHTCVTDACFGSSSAVAAFSFWLSLASHELHVSVSKSTLVRAASESGPAHSGRMHIF